MVDPRYFRPTEVDYLLGNPAKVREAFGWKPSVSFKQLVRMMVDHDIQLGEQDRMIQTARYPSEVSVAAKA
jgi:GDPmannose 4,6-dehydratase